MTLESIIAQYGLAALFLGAGLEGETSAVLGGVMVHRGILGYLPAMGAAAAGSFLADQLFFALGRRFRDHRYVRRWRKRAAFQRAIAAFERRPTLFIFGFRFLYGLRTVSPIAIGTTNLAPARFVAINALAALTWGTIFVTLGYLFGEGIEEAFGRVRDVGYVLVPLCVLLVVGRWITRLARRKREARKGVLAAAAGPGDA